MALTPRKYQADAIDEIRSLILKGRRRILCQLATGGGKTFIFSSILRGAHGKGTPCIMVVRSRHLVDQASRRLHEMGVDHGVLMANDSRYDLAKPIQVASIDTCRARNMYPAAKLVVIDEAHYATSDSFKDFLSHYDDAIWISVTATPWAKGGLKHLASDVVYPISFADLVTQGFLAPAKYFIASKFDSSTIKTANGEFIDKDSLAAFEKQAIYGDVVKNYSERCHGECTWVFAINIAHAQKLKSEFASSGFDSVIITGDTPLSERSNILDSFNLVISIGTLTTGVDVPRLKNIILCRPTKSRNLHVQIIGRGTRLHPGKRFFCVYDHVGNIARHGFIIDEQKINLDEDNLPIKTRSKSKTSSPDKVKQCPQCLAAVLTASQSCHECNYLFEKKEIATISCDMIELKQDIKSRVSSRIDYHLLDIWSMGYKFGAVWFRLLSEFDEETLRRHYRLYRRARMTWLDWSSGASSPPCSYGARRFIVDQYSGGDGA